MLAVVHQLADGGFTFRCDLDQIHDGFGGEFARLLDGHDADLLALGANQAHFLDVVNLVIQPGTLAMALAVTFFDSPLLHSSCRS